MDEQLNMSKTDEIRKRASITLPDAHGLLEIVAESLREDVKYLLDENERLREALTKIDADNVTHWMSLPQPPDTLKELAQEAQDMGFYDND